MSDIQPMRETPNDLDGPLATGIELLRDPEGTVFAIVLRDISGDPIAVLPMPRAEIRNFANHILHYTRDDA